MELTSALKATKTLKAFVEKGQMEEALGAISITAALDSFKKAVRANDPRSQMWSAINHLEQSGGCLSKECGQASSFISGYVAVFGSEYQLCLCSLPSFGIVQILGRVRPVW